MTTLVLITWLALAPPSHAFDFLSGEPFCWVSDSEFPVICEDEE
jgi:hypothetical protein